MKQWLLTMVLIPVLAWAENQLPRIAVLDFEPKGVVKTDIADFMTERTRIELFKTGKYDIVERKEIDKIIEEQKLALSGLTSGEFAVKLGQLLSAQKMLLGSMNQVGGRYYINLRIVNVESGVMEFGDTFEATDDNALSAVASQIAQGVASGNMKKTMDLQQQDPSKDFSFDSVVNYVRKGVAEKNEFVETITNLFKDWGEQKPDISPVQNEPAKPIVWGESGFTVGPVLDFGLNALSFPEYSLSGQTLHIGGKFVWYFNEYFGLGAGGFGTLLMTETRNTNYSFGKGYGGAVFNFHNNDLSMVNFSLDIMIGAGGYSIYNHTYMNIITNNDQTNGTLLTNYGQAAEGSAFFFIEPSIVALFRMTDFLEIGTQIGYLYIPRVNGRDLSQFKAGFTVRASFGK